MYIQRLLILQLVVSLGIVAQVPGNIRLLHDRYECTEPEDEDLPAWLKTVFPRPTLLRPEQQRGIVFSQNGTALKHITPPPEFRGKNAVSEDVGGVSPLIPRWHFCHGTTKGVRY
jgi:hypothetical protein